MMARVRRPADGRAQRIAEFLVRDRLAGDVLLLEKLAQPHADRIHARLVVGAAVDVHDVFEQREHRALLAAEPLDHSLFALPARRHERLLNKLTLPIHMTGISCCGEGRAAFIPPRMDLRILHGSERAARLPQ